MGNETSGSQPSTNSTDDVYCNFDCLSMSSLGNEQNGQAQVFAIA